MEGTLESPHPVLEMHFEQPVLDRRRRIMERQQVREGVSVGIRFLQYSVLVQPGDHPDRLGHQVVGTHVGQVTDEDGDGFAPSGRVALPALLAVQLGESGTPWEAQGLTPPDYFTLLVEQPERSAQFTRMLYEIHVPLADELAASLPMDGVARLLDVGGGSGVMSLALLRRHPRPPPLRTRGLHRDPSCLSPVAVARRCTRGRRRA